MEIGILLLKYYIFKNIISYISKNLFMSNTRHPKLCFLSLLKTEKINPLFIDNSITHYKSLFTKNNNPDTWNSLPLLTFIDKNMILKNFARASFHTDKLKIAKSTSICFIQHYTYDSPQKTPTYLHSFFVFFIKGL